MSLSCCFVNLRNTELPSEKGIGLGTRRMNAETYVVLSIGSGVALVFTAYVTWDRPQVPRPLAPAESKSAQYTA